MHFNKRMACSLCLHSWRISDFSAISILNLFFGEINFGMLSCNNMEKQISFSLYCIKYIYIIFTLGIEFLFLKYSNFNVNGFLTCIKHKKGNLSVLTKIFFFQTICYLHFCNPKYVF